MNDLSISEITFFVAYDLFTTLNKNPSQRIFNHNTMKNMPDSSDSIADVNKMFFIHLWTLKGLSSASLP